MAKKVILNEDELREKLTGELPVFIPPIAQVHPEKVDVASTSPSTAEVQKSPEKANATSTSPATAKEVQEQPEKTNATDVLLPDMDADDDAFSKSASVESKTDKDLERYEKTYLRRNLLGVQRTNVGISMSTLVKIEQVINRLFDGRIAASTFVDNILYEHLLRHKKLYDKWLAERSQTIF
jgi:hypothetical protein